MFFKIPNGWRTYSQSNLKQDGLVSSAVPYLIAFDANPEPDVTHLLDSSAYPWGLAEVAPSPAPTASTSRSTRCSTPSSRLTSCRAVREAPSRSCRPAG